MKKKLVGLFVAMLTVGLLAGCGKDEGTNESATDIAVESTEAGTAESTILLHRQVLMMHRWNPW